MALIAWTTLCSNTLAGIYWSQVRVYESQARDVPLDLSTKIDGLGLDEDHALIVKVVPRQTNLFRPIQVEH